MYNNILVAVVDYGITKNLKIVLSSLNVPFFIIEPNDIPNYLPTHIILSGSPDHVYDDKHRNLPNWVINSNIPVLGICYGMQIIAHTFGGFVGKLEEKENGIYNVIEYMNGEWIKNNRWFNRFDNVYICPENFNIIGYNDKNLIVAITDNIKYWCVQYHPENPNAIDYDLFISFLNY
jgi:GMP synthase (glutamine-hydrolysing)